jgi:hypothetical protein
MKRTLNFALTFLLGMFGVIGFVKADTSKCTSEMKSEFSKSVASASASYEFVYDDAGNVKGFDITVYNIPDKMNVLYSTNVENNKKSGSIKIENGKGKVYDDNLTDIYSYSIEIYSLETGCNYKVKTLKVVKPKRNTYSDSVYCSYDETEKSSYCEEWITREINKSLDEVEEILKKNLVKSTTTEATSKCVDCGLDSIGYSLKDFYKKYKYTIIIATVLSIVLVGFAIVLLIKSGKGGVI